MEATITADGERAVIRRAAARAIRYRRYEQRTKGKKSKRARVRGYQGQTAGDVLDGFVDFSERPKYWHALASAASALANEVMGRDRRRRFGPQESQARRVA